MGVRANAPCLPVLEAPARGEKKAGNDQLEIANPWRGESSFFGLSRHLSTAFPGRQAILFAARIPLPLNRP
jgi:hypothetical protein